MLILFFFSKGASIALIILKLDKALLLIIKEGLINDNVYRY